MTAGYTHPAYAGSLSEFGEPIALPHSGGWLLERTVPGTDHRDARGPYPLFCCTNWKELGRDLDALRGRLISSVVVADPFGAYDEAILQSSFDRVIPFKSHFVVDLERSRPLGTAHHRYYARRALRNLAVEVCSQPQSNLAEWIALYSQLSSATHLPASKHFRRSRSAANSRCRAW